MSARLKGLSATLAIAAAMVFGVVGAGGATQFPLFGPDGGALCDGGGVVQGSDLGFGFATISGDATIKAKVTAEALSPNTTYLVRLIQGVPDCGVTDATFKTNKHGHGQVTVHEASVSGHAYVFIATFDPTEFYATETYFH
jgi:hypothetical protein